MDSFEWITVKGVKLYVWTKHALNTKMKMTLVYTDRRHFDVESLAHNRDVFFTISSLETGFFQSLGTVLCGTGEALQWTRPRKTTIRSSILGGFSSYEVSCNG